MKIEVEIDELVLHGFAPADRWRIADAIQDELARHFAAAPPSTSSRSLPSLDAGSFRVHSGAPAAHVGGQIAGRIAGAIGERSR